MLNSSSQTEPLRPAAGEGREIECIDNWLRGLSDAEISELREALNSHNTEKLARYHTRLQASLHRFG